MEPLHTIYEPAGDGPHPTLLALHGWGVNALDLLGLAPYLADGRFLMLCPQGSVVVPLGAMVGYGWFPLTLEAPPDAAAFTTVVDGLKRFLDAVLRRYPIEASKLVALGFSQGGALAYALALADPARFAGLVVLSSWLPDALVQRLPAIGSDRLPALVHHGTQDDLVPVERGRESVEALRRLQVPVTYREFDMGHEITAVSLTHLSAWLEEKILSPILYAR
jgi:phospholipase/carboxylesterase